MLYFDKLCEYISSITSIAINIVRPFMGTMVIIILTRAFKIFVSGLIRDLSKNKRKVYDRIHNFGMLVDSFTALLLVLFLGRYISNLTIFVSLIVSALTFALRDLIIGLFYSIYIRKHNLFKVGDRIEIDGIKGDVINIGRLTFEILEVQNEEYGQSTGCIISIPNILISMKEVKNYNKGFRYVWTEVKINIPRDADINKSKDLIYMVVNSIDLIKDIPVKLEKELAHAQTYYKIYYNDYKPIIYTKVCNKYNELSVRFLMDAKKIRNVEEEIWLKLVDEDKKGNIELYKES